MREGEFGLKILKKLKNRSGFTLFELLATMLILVMVAGVVAAGMPVASEAFVKAVDGANAQTLLSTAISALRDELNDATQVKIGATDGSVSYFNAGSGSQSKLYRGTDNIMLQQYIGFESANSLAPARQLVTAEASTKNLYVTYASVALKDGVVTFTDLAVYNKTLSSNPVVKTDLSIRVASVAP